MNVDAYARRKDARGSMTFAAPDSATTNSMRIPSIVVLGAKRTARFSLIIKGSGLDEGDKNALIFDKVAHDEPLPEGFQYIGKIPDDLKRDWREGVAELGLRGDEDGLLAMVHIIEGWKPGPDTPVQFPIQN